MDKKLAWLWLADAVGSGCQYARELLDLWPDPVELYEALHGMQTMPPACLSDAAAEQLACTSPYDYEECMDHCLLTGVAVLTPDDGAYPARMRALPDLPLALYVTGDPACLNGRRYAGLVGTRRPDPYGRQAAYDLALAMAKAGVVIVSGLADGLDSAGHRAAVKNGCPTIGILGVPIDRTYPAANVALRHTIEQNGCILSEYAPGESTPGPVGFLQRNRLIAALSSALLVVEAREKSGTMSTVSHAERYGKPVFAVPGSIYSPDSAGTNRLLHEGRARAACSGADLVQALGLQASAAPEAEIRQPDPMTDTERRVLACVGPQPLGVEELCVRSGLPTASLLSTLMKLQLTGRVTCLPGKRYVLR